MLAQYGTGRVALDWRVEEKTAPLSARMYVVRSGTVTYRDASCTLSLKADHLYLFPTACAYGMEQEESDPLDCLFFHLDFFEQVVREVVELSLEEHPFLAHWAEAAQAVMDSEMADAYGILSALAQALERYFDQEGLLTQPLPMVAKALHYIAQHFDQEVSVAQLSDLTGYHPQYFIRLFRQSYGMTPHNCLMQYRLKQGMKLLQQDTSYSVTQVAQMVGYADLKTFSRAFKGYFGVSPREFGRYYVPLP